MQAWIVKFEEFFKDQVTNPQFLQGTTAAQNSPVYHASIQVFKISILK